MFDKFKRKKAHAPLDVTEQDGDNFTPYEKYMLTRGYSRADVLRGRNSDFDGYNEIGAMG